MKFAYFVIPHAGGTYTVYKSLRAGLAAHDIEVFWLGLGPSAKTAAEDQRWINERDHGVVLAGDTDDVKLQAQALIQFFDSGACDGVFVSVLADRVATNAMRYVSPSVKRIMIVHSITRGTYGAARAIRDHVHATVGVSPRIRSDLIKNYGFQPKHTHSIPTAVNINAFEQVSRSPNSQGPLRLLSLGRIINNDKGVFWLPEIMKHLSEHEARLTIAGDGPDLPELKRRCAHMTDRISFIGRVAYEQVPDILANHDVFLFPSRFEGLGLALVEAMATGCVPVASRIKGVTDFVIQDGEDGILFNMGDLQSAARAISTLSESPDRLARLSAAARQNTKGRFDLASMANAYCDVIHKVTQNPAAIRAPLPIGRWAYPAGLRPGLRTYLPMGVKNWLRLWLERLA